MASTPIQVAVLTVGDNQALDATKDKSGPALQTLLNAREGYECKESLIVPDNTQRIQDAIKKWCGQGIDVIITTGGTGFSPRYVTPEAVKGLLEREAPGIVHLLLTESFKHTPAAAISRPVAGTIGNTFVVTFPGGVNAVTENLTALLGGNVLDHLVGYMRSERTCKIERHDHSAGC